MLQRILIGALLAGAITGILFTAIQRLQVEPLIVKAEMYESSGTAITHSAQDSQDGHATTASSSAENTQRLLFTLLSNILAGIGFALVIASGITFTGHNGWRKGLLWGLAGFAAFFVAPALGLTPKLPGTLGAPLEQRQLWWIFTVTTSVAGLSLLVFARHKALKGVGVLLLAVPHLVGAPLPEQNFSMAPESMSKAFIVATTIANAAFWLILGVLSGYFLRKPVDLFKP